MHKALHNLHMRVANLECAQSTATTGVLLWGPPGCGKSGIASDLMSRSQKPAYFVNSDAVQAELMRVSQANLSRADALKLLFEKLYPPGCFTQPSSEEMEAFLLQNHDDHGATADEFSELVVFLAKRRKHNFIIETTGDKFDYSWAKRTFDGTTRSLLQVAYVNSVDTCIGRVARRAAQSGDASPDALRLLYSKSYSGSLKKAILCTLFDEIAVMSNDSRRPRVLMHMFKSFAQLGYALKISPPAHLNHGEYVFLRGMLENTGLPIMMIHE